MTINTMTNTQNNKRIVKNTLLLYFRMLFTMLVSLYTSRIVLNALGINDFGIYNVVGGLIIMLTFINNAMATATQRFLTFELGKNEFDQLRKVFNISLFIHLIIAFIILFFGETCGLWFLNTQMKIPIERMDAANLVYQISILTCMVSILNVPYNAVVIAHEKMSVFAYISILEVMLKLAIVYILTIYNFDKLKLYAILIFFVQITCMFVYMLYSKKNFAETKLSLILDMPLLRRMSTFASWNLLGNLSNLAYTQGLNILLNVFFGPVVNAARGVAVQVQSAIVGFYVNFQTAVNPQITKYYAKDDIDNMHLLLKRTSKFSFFLLFFISLPILIETKQILIWWLKVVPDFSIIFLRLIMITSMIDSITTPFVTAIQATGKIQKYQMIIGNIFLSIVPLSYMALKLGATPEYVFIIHLVIASIAAIIRLFIVCPLIFLSIKNYLKDVISRILLVVILSIIFPITLYLNLSQNILNFFVICFSCVISVVMFVYFLGLTLPERAFVKSNTCAFISRIKNYNI